MNKPFLLRPSAKDYLWGGSRLNDEFAKNINVSPLAETWECSTHPDGHSYVASGDFSGSRLMDVLKSHPEYIGTHPATVSERCKNGELPILIKFIDAKKDLSVQVHPTDEYAGVHEKGQMGKTEMWYILDAAKDASIIYGLWRDVEKEKLRASISDGTLEKYLQRVPVNKDEVFFINAGTIHAIGEGVLVAEIQENSNLTYRMYDYDRADKDGKRRELHIDKALDVANLKQMQEPRQPLRVLKYSQGVATELLARCRYFEVHRMLVNTERRQEVHFRSDELSFRVLLCINGCGSISFISNGNFPCETLNIYKGDCIFVPASSVDIRIHGQVQFLDVRS